MNIKKSLTILTILIAVVAAFYIYIQNKDYKTVKINSTEIRVYIAKTPEEKSLGLSIKDSIKDNEGMLFIYQNKVTPTFWMKNMKFPIDIIWILNNTIIGVEKNVEARQDYTLYKYSPPQSINLVLEVNAGIFDKYNFKIGDRIDIKN